MCCKRRLCSNACSQPLLRKVALIDSILSQACIPRRSFTIIQHIHRQTQEEIFWLGRTVGLKGFMGLSCRRGRRSFFSGSPWCIPFAGPKYRHSGTKSLVALPLLLGSIVVLTMLMHSAHADVIEMLMLMSDWMEAGNRSRNPARLARNAGFATSPVQRCTISALSSTHSDSAPNGRIRAWPVSAIDM